MKLRLCVCLLLTLTSANGFFYSSTDPIDCAWLPWTYRRCTRIGNGQYRKVETRMKINAMYGGRDCAPGPTSRETETCNATDYVASHILTAISSERRRGLYNQEGVEGAEIQFASRGNWYPQSRNVLPRTTPPPRTVYSLRGRRLCANTFTDPSTEVRMLGSNCNHRRERSIGESTIKSRVKRQFTLSANIKSDNHRDILFLVDESGSVGEENFRKEKELVKVLAGKFCYKRRIGIDATRVGLATFSSNHVHRITFREYGNSGEFGRAVDEINYRSEHDGNTCLISALKAARVKMFTAMQGSRVPYGGADGLLVLITDGCLNCWEEDVTQALQSLQKSFEESGISILSFVVTGDNGCDETFKALQDSSVCFQGFTYPSWAEFDQQIEALLKVDTCFDHWTKQAETCP